MTYSPVVHFAKVCPGCNELFIPKRSDTIFCSRACINENVKVQRRKKNLLRLKPIECVICSSVFKPIRSNQVCCSQACNHKKQKLKEKKINQQILESITRICKSDTCNNSFTPQLRKDQLFCCSECADRQGKRDWKKRNIEAYKKSERIRTKRKYQTDETYRESIKEKVNKRFHKLTPEEKLSLGRRHRARRDKEKVRKYHRFYQKQRSQVDIDFKLTNNLRSLTRQAIIRGEGTKSKRTMELLGCSIEECRSYLESLFDSRMSWNNFGDWHIDHIRPCSSFDMRVLDQQELCFNWRNLRPLWGVDNLSKKDQYHNDDEINWVKLFRQLGFEGNLFVVYQEEYAI